MVSSQVRNCGFGLMLKGQTTIATDLKLVNDDVEMNEPSENESDLEHNVSA